MWKGKGGNNHILKMPFETPLVCIELYSGFIKAEGPSLKENHRISLKKCILGEI